MLQQKHVANIKQYAKEFAQNEPFAHLVLDDIVEENAIQALGEQLLDEQFYEKYADLFHFYQTNDLQYTENASFKKLLQQFHEELYDFFSQVTNIPLDKDKLDIQGSIYADGNYLLCHDDQLEGRAIAFILYLTDLEPPEGGALRLYASKGDEPDEKIFKDIQPRVNRLAFFAVTEKSFHEVREVLVDKQRVAIGGWLHHA